MKKIIMPLLMMLFLLSGCSEDKTIYEVNYNTNGGTDISSVEVEDNSLLSLPSNPEKDGFSFISWFTDEALTISFDVQKPITSDITLYAKWEAEVIEVNYEVSFDTVGGAAIESIIISENSSITFPTAPQKIGYTFGGWYKESTYRTRYIETLPVTEDLILYAKWSPVNTILNLMNGDTIIGGIYLTYGSEVSIPDINIAGYDFGGWFAEDTLINQVSSVTGALIDQKLYIKLNDINFNGESIDVTTLPYYEYMNENNPVVTITIQDVGDLTIELFPNVAKNTVDNFITYILAGEYSGSTFHRIIEDFMIQGGIIDNPNCPITGEFLINGIANDLSHFRGVISMARTSVKDSATSQFFIVHEDSAFLDGSYAAFGGLTAGFNILDNLASVTTGSGDEPLSNVVIESITVELNGYVVAIPICAQ